MPNSQGPLVKLLNHVILTIQYIELLSNHVSKYSLKTKKVYYIVFFLHIVITTMKQQSLNFSKSQLEQTTESQSPIYKGVLHSKELFYTVYLQCNPFHITDFFVICPIFAVAHAYMYSCSPCHVRDKATNCQLYLSPLMYNTSFIIK